MLVCVVTLLERHLVFSVFHIYMTYRNFCIKSPHISQESGVGEYVLGKTNLNEVVVGQPRVTPWEFFVSRSRQCLWNFTP